MMIQLKTSIYHPRLCCGLRKPLEEEKGESPLALRRLPTLVDGLDLAGATFDEPSAEGKNQVVHKIGAENK